MTCRRWRAAGWLAWLLLPCRALAQADAPIEPSPPPPSAAEAAPRLEVQPPPSAADATPSPPSAADTPSLSLSPSGPAIELPPEAPSEGHGGLQLGVNADDDDALLRGLAPQRMAQSRTVVGGYGQFDLEALRQGNNGRFNSTANVRRIVLFVAHPITEDIRIYTEFEWENAVASPSFQGSAEVEQAFVQWRLAGDLLALRVGLVLVPMGIVNQWHEPPVFNGVERPMVDQLIIPSTWRELAAGFVGNWRQLLRYELYLSTTLNPTKLSETGLQGATTLGSFAPAKAFAVMGRAEVEPWLGVIAGASFFLSNTGPNGDFFDAEKHREHLALPVLGYALDARMRRWGFEARAVWAQFFLPNSDALMNALNNDGSPIIPLTSNVGAVPMRVQGGYFELAYNVFSLTSITHELLGFVRLEYYNSQASVPSSYVAEGQLDVREVTMGLTYRPITQLVFKTDVQLRDRRLGKDELQYNLGFGYMF